MITYKMVLDERRAKAGGKYPIMFRITSNRNTSNYYSGIAVNKEHWDAESATVNSLCPNYRELNKNLTTKFLKAQKLILQLEDEGSFSFEKFKELLNGHTPTVAKTKPQPALFLPYSNQLIADMIVVKRTGGASVYQTAVNRVITFSGNKSLKIEAIDFTFLDNFQRHLVEDGVKQNTIGNYLRSIRAIWNKSIKGKLVDRSLYPFTDITIKTEKTAKRALRVDDLIKIYRAEYKPNTPKWNARNYFLLSFCLRGMSFIDMAYLTQNNIVRDRVAYSRQKTKSKLDIKLIPLAKSILDCYKGKNDKYLLPVFPCNMVEGGEESKKISRQWIKTTNKWLKRMAIDCEIDAEITTYVTRHSWATTAKRLGYSNELIAECLGHQYGNKITNIYLDDFDQAIVDDVNERVILSIEPCRKQILIFHKFVLKNRLVTLKGLKFNLAA
jgi:integrase/recombinase XerD